MKNDGNKRNGMKRELNHNKNLTSTNDSPSPSIYQNSQTDKDIQKWIQERKSRHPSRLPVLSIKENTSREFEDDKEKNCSSKEEKIEKDKEEGEEEEEEGAIPDDEDVSDSTRLQAEIVKSNKKRICQYFIKGKCRKGNDCNFSHEKNVKNNNNNEKKPSLLSLPQSEKDENIKIKKEQKNRNMSLRKPKRRPLLEILGHDEIIEQVNELK